MDRKALQASDWGGEFFGGGELKREKKNEISKPIDQQFLSCTGVCIYSKYTWSWTWTESEREKQKEFLCVGRQLSKNQPNTKRKI